MGNIQFNKDELLSNFKGDEDILIDLISEFEIRSHKMLAEINQSIIEKNAGKLKLSAHSFKGVISNFYAEEMRLLAYDLEKMGEENNLTEAPLKIGQLKKLLDVFLIEIGELKQTLK